jgi:hypothetical protein
MWCRRSNHLGHVEHIFALCCIPLLHCCIGSRGVCFGSGEALCGVRSLVQWFACVEPLPLPKGSKTCLLQVIFVTPDFPKKTKCIPICTTGSSLMHIETVSRKKKGDYQRFMLNPGNEGTKHHRQSTGGCVRLAPATSSHHLHVASSF